MPESVRTPPIPARHPARVPLIWNQAMRRLTHHNGYTRGIRGVYEGHTGGLLGDSQSARAAPDPPAHPSRKTSRCRTVTQICNLLYRRFAICLPWPVRTRLDGTGALPLTNRRYGRLQVQCRQDLRGGGRTNGRQLRRNDMCIARDPKQDRCEPHGGGMVARGGDHAAPTELEGIIEGAVAIHMPILRSWASAGLCRNRGPDYLNPASSGHPQR